MINKKVENIFCKIFYGLFVCMMVSAVFFVIHATYNKIYLEYFMMGVVYVSIFFFFISVIGSKIQQTERKKEIILVISIICLAFLLRWIFISVLKTVQVSDFNMVHLAIEDYKNQNKITGYFKDYYSRFPAWFPYMRLVNWYYNVFCDGTINIEAVKYANAIINALTCGEIYCTAKKMFSKKIASIAAFLYACSPSLIIYSSITTPDHITMLLMGGEMMMWNMLWNKRNETKIYCLWCFFFSILCVLINWFKPVNVFFLIVFICCELTIGNTEKKIDKTLVMREVRCILCFMLSFIIILNIGDKFLNFYVEKHIEEKVVDSTWLYIYAGLEMNEDGSVASTNTNVEELQKKYTNQEIIMKEAKRLAIETIKTNIYKIPNLLISKYKAFVESENNYWYWANTNEIDGYKNQLDNVVGLLYFFFSNIYMLGIFCLLTIMGIVQLVCGKRNDKLVSIALTVFGYFLLLMLSVQQSRYKSIVMPQICLLAAYGMEETKTCISKIGKIKLTKCHFKNSKLKQTD